MKEQVLSFLIFVSNESKLKINQVHTSFEHYSYHQQIYESRAWDKQKKIPRPHGEMDFRRKKKNIYLAFDWLNSRPHSLSYTNHFHGNLPSRLFIDTDLKTYLRSKRKYWLII